MSIKSIVFDGERYTVQSLRAQAARMSAAGLIDAGFVDPADYTTDVLLELVARRRFGRRAWVYSYGVNSWRQDGTGYHIAATVGIGARTRHGQRFGTMMVVVDRDEIATVAAAIGDVR